MHTLFIVFNGRINIFLVSLELEVTLQFKDKMAVPSLVNTGDLLNALFCVDEFLLFTVDLCFSEMSPTVAWIVSD